MAAQGHRYISVLKGAPVEEQEQQDEEGEDADPYIFDDRGSATLDSDAVVVSHESMISHETMDLIEKAMLDKIEPARGVTKLETVQAADTLEPQLIDLELSDDAKSPARPAATHAMPSVLATCTTNAPELAPQVEMISSALCVESNRETTSVTDQCVVQPSLRTSMAVTGSKEVQMNANGSVTCAPLPVNGLTALPGAPPRSAPSESVKESSSTVPNDATPKPLGHKLPIGIEEDGFESAEAQRSATQRPSAAARSAAVDVDMEIDLWEAVGMRVEAEPETTDARPML